MLFWVLFVKCPRITRTPNRPYNYQNWRFRHQTWLNQVKNPLGRADFRAGKMTASIDQIHGSRDPWQLRVIWTENVGFDPLQTTNWWRNTNYSISWNWPSECRWYNLWATVKGWFGRYLWWLRHHLGRLFCKALPNHVISKMQKRVQLPHCFSRDSLRLNLVATHMKISSADYLKGSGNMTNREVYGKQTRPK